jgi:hypothetical protein
MKIADRIQEAFLRNPIAWVLLAAFLIAEYGNYQRGRELDQVCEAMPDPILIQDHPRTPKELADKICAGRNSN